MSDLPFRPTGLRFTPAKKTFLELMISKLGRTPEECQNRFNVIKTVSVFIASSLVIYAYAHHLTPKDQFAEVEQIKDLDTLRAASEPRPPTM